MTRHLLAAAAALLVVVGAALAADTPPANADDAAVRKAMERFRREYDTKDLDLRMEAIGTVSKTVHPTVAQELLKLARDKDEHIRESAARGLGRQLTSAGKAGPVLVKVAVDTAEVPRTVAAAVRSIGSLEWRKAEPDLERLIEHEDDQVVVAVFNVYGAWKDDSALQAMLDFFQRYPDEKKFSTGTVTVDTGSEGNEDQKAAEAKWKAKYGGQRNWRPRPECVKALRAALKEITGHDFRRPEDLAAYIADPQTYVDPETIKDRLPEADRQAVYRELEGIKDEALRLAAKEVPGEEASDERAKAYWKHLREMRDKLLEKRKLTLSELDVILEEGETKRWPRS